MGQTVHFQEKFHSFFIVQIGYFLDIIYIIQDNVLTNEQYFR